MHPVQLNLILPPDKTQYQLAMTIAHDYTLRIAEETDLPHFFDLMTHVGWTDWGYTKLTPWKARLLDQGWFVITHNPTQTLVASAMALRDCCEWGEQGGEIGWVAARSDHAGLGLGRAVSSAAINRFKAENYHYIHLYTEDYRLAAIKIYLSLGMIPVLNHHSMGMRWYKLCQQLNWPFTPKQWRNIVEDRIQKKR